MRRAWSSSLATLVLAGCGLGGGDERDDFLVGVVEDSTRLPDAAAARARLQTVVRRGLRRDPDHVDLVAGPDRAGACGARCPAQRRQRRAGDLDVRLFIAVYHAGSATTPLTDEARSEFASYTASIARELPVRDFIIGNEPNLNRFWMPQFGPGGENVAARSTCCCSRRTTTPSRRCPTT